jgi:hypothetical protein
LRHCIFVREFVGSGDLPDKWGDPYMEERLFRFIKFSVASEFELLCSSFRSPDYTEQNIGVSALRFRTRRDENEVRWYGRLDQKFDRARKP